MAKPLVSDELWAIVEPLLPPEPPKPKGGRPACPRPRLPDRDHLRAQERHPLGAAAAGDGLWQRHDLLAPPARLAGGRRLAAAAPGAARPPRRGRPDRLGPGQSRQRQRPGQKGGAESGPNPTDRGKPGSKHHLLVDRQGIPLAVPLSAANVHDSQLLEATVDAVPPIKRPRGRPRKRPVKLHADKGDDYPISRQRLRHRHIVPRIARRGIESSARLGRHRWVVERTLAWLHRFRRLIIRSERRADLHRAFLSLGCALICWNYVQARLC